MTWRTLLACLCFAGIGVGNGGLVCSAMQATFVPIGKLKVVETNVDNESDGEGDYYLSRASCNVRVMVRAGEEITAFTLYITYDGGQTWLNAQTETALPTCWKSLDYSFSVADEATASAIRLTGNPVELDWIAGIKVTCNDGGGERSILTVLGRDVATLDLSLIDGEFDTVFESKPMLTVETWVEWKRDLDWPENKNEDVVLYTVGLAGTVPMVGQSIPADYPLAANKGAAEGGYEVWRFKRCSGSWGVRLLFVDFPAARLRGEKTNTATAILIRGATGDGGSIEEMSDETYEYEPG